MLRFRPGQQKRRTTRDRRHTRPRHPGIESLEARWMPSLTVLFADAIAASGSGSVDVESNAVVNDASGNVFVVGSFTGTVDFDPSATTLNLTASGGRDLFLARFTSAGSLSWVKKLPGSNSSAVALGEAITLDASGNILIAGTFTGSVNFDPAGANAGATFNAGTRNDVFLARYDGNGSLSWARDLVGGVNLSAHGYALATDASGNITLAGSFQTALTVGTTTLSGAGTTDGFVARANSAGQFAWAVATNGAGTSQVQTTGVSLDGSGNVLTTGFIAGTADFQPGAGATNLASNGGSRDIFVQKLDGNGGFVWAVAIGSPDIDQGNAIKADAAGNVYVTGTFSMSADFDPGAGTTTLTAGGFDDPFLLKLTPSGGLSWARRFALSGFNFGHGTGVGLDASNHVFVTGYYQGTMVVDAVSSASIMSAGGFDVFLVEYDTSGNYVASQSFGGANFDAAFGVGVNASGQVALAGRFSGPAAFGSINLPAQSGKSIFVTQVATTILQAPPPAPAAPVLQAASDTGSSNSDRVTSRTSLTFDLSGASAPGNLLELLRDGVVVASRTGDGPITDPGPVSDGTRTYTARQTNASSQVSPISTATTVVIDTQAPGTPSVLVLVTADDSSTKGDGITNVRLPRFTGTGPASTLIQLIDAGGNVVGSTTSAADGSFTLTPALNLADGSYGFRARAVDLAGNVGTAGTALALVIDATAPATAPAPAILAADDTGTLGDNLTSKRQPRLVGTVEALATVRL
ncbi:MAG: Ig-like domain-containing protein [Isosphaeraceae bacterium]